uniref:L1 transposable element RRM domain-containing protein n=1 Tax=Salarias fasciatus TaxID=181472 RepID=A0A672HZU7_SALFA
KKIRPMADGEKCPNIGLVYWPELSADIKTQIGTLHGELHNQSELSNDYKKASRRQNIRIVGVDEDSEKSNPTRFVVDLVMQILGRENFRSPLIIDRAHRTLGPKPGPGERPRALLVRLHYYTGKEKILQLSREKGQLLYNGSPVHIFPDTSPEVTRLRASFKHVKAKLRTSDVPYSLFYPAKLLITAKGSRYVFTDPQEAEKFVAEITTA